MYKLLLTFISVLLYCLSFTQGKQIIAVKTASSIKIDGDGDDHAWQGINPVSDFTTSTPVYGKKPIQNTVVKITYDNTAVYILAYMHNDASSIRKQLTARDDVDFQDVDVFSVGLDTYHDKQNGFLFQVTAAGVQSDAKISGSVDKTWDAVWGKQS